MEEGVSSNSSNRHVWPFMKRQQRSRVYLRIPKNKSGSKLIWSVYGADAMPGGDDTNVVESDSSIKEEPNGLPDTEETMKQDNDPFAQSLKPRIVGVPCHRKFVDSLGCEDKEVDCRVTLLFFSLLCFLITILITEITEYVANSSTHYISWFLNLLPFIMICLVVVIPALFVGTESDGDKPEYVEMEMDQCDPEVHQCWCFKRFINVSFFLVLGALLTVLALMLDKWMDQQTAQVCLIVLGSIGFVLLVLLIRALLVPIAQRAWDELKFHNVTGKQSAEPVCVKAVRLCCMNDDVSNNVNNNVNGDMRDNKARKIYVSSLIGLLVAFVALPILKATPWIPMFRNAPWITVLTPITSLFSAISMGIFASLNLSLVNDTIDGTVRELKCFMSLFATSLSFLLIALGYILSAP